jgi:hypothetical protein
VVMFIFVAGLTFNMWEYFPENAMLMFVWGVAFGTSHCSINSEGSNAMLKIYQSKIHYDL